jgi:2-isopropylmalate synthase
MGMVSLGIGDQSRSVEATGNGPVDALYGAIDEAIESVLGWKPVLAEYEIKAVTAGEDAQGQVIARVRRSTEEGPDAFVATGHGLSTNIIEASVAAYLAGAEKLQQDAVTKAAILEAARASGQAPEKVEKLP